MRNTTPLISYEKINNNRDYFWIHFNSHKIGTMELGDDIENQDEREIVLHFYKMELATSNFKRIQNLDSFYTFRSFTNAKKFIESISEKIVFNYKRLL